MRNKKVIIIGAGIAGLTAAMKLSTSGVSVEVYEQHEKPGGKIRYFNILMSIQACDIPLRRKKCRHPATRGAQADHRDRVRGAGAQ